MIEGVLYVKVVCYQQDYTHQHQQHSMFIYVFMYVYNSRHVIPQEGRGTVA